jgi:predicted transcriptional regulator of viral defense system
MTAVTNSIERPNLLGLEALALRQGGYFDRKDALEFGLSDYLLHYHTATRRIERMLPGVYRFHAAPVSPDDEYFLAWVWTNYRGAISHESALALYELGDALPSVVHVTVPRPFLRTSSPFRVHRAPLPDDEVRMYHGVRATSPARSIVDAAATGTDSHQIFRAVRDCLERGLETADALRAAVHRQPNQHIKDVRRLIEDAITNAGS